MAYKTEIIGGVVVHTPISINQVSWQVLRAIPNPGGKTPATAAPRFGPSVPCALRAAPNGDKQRRRQVALCGGIPTTPRFDAPAPAAGGPAAPEPGSEGSLPAGGTVRLLLWLPCWRGRAGPGRPRLHIAPHKRPSDARFRTGERGEGACRGATAAASRCALPGLSSTGEEKRCWATAATGSVLLRPACRSSRGCGRGSPGWGGGSGGALGVRGRSGHGAGGSRWLSGRLMCAFISGNQLGACKPFPLRGV